MRCTKAIIPIAGFGTRRLPITKAVEKYMLPVGNRPIIDYVVEDCVKAGIKDIFFVVSEQNDQLRRFYGRNEDLERYLKERNKTHELELLESIAREAAFHYVVQPAGGAYGTAVPVDMCAQFVESDEQVLVMMGDDFIYNADGSSEARRLLDAVSESGVTAGLLAVRLPKEDVARYGVLETKAAAPHRLFQRIVECPSVAEAPSDLINVSKYVFDKQMFDAVHRVLESPAKKGEFYVTEALNMYVDDGRDLLVVDAHGEYLDGGTLAGWLHANQRVCAVT